MIASYVTYSTFVSHPQNILSLRELGPGYSGLRSCWVRAVDQIISIKILSFIRIAYFTPLREIVEGGICAASFTCEKY